MSALRSPFPIGELGYDGLGIPGASILLSLCLRERNEGDCRTNDSPAKVGKRVRPSRRSRSLTYKGRVDDEFATDPAVRPAG
jgi:hypothetical protein